MLTYIKQGFIIVLKLNITFTEGKEMTDIQKALKLMDAIGKIEASLTRAEAVRNGIGRFDAELLADGLNLMANGLQDALELVKVVESDLEKGA